MSTKRAGGLKVVAARGGGRVVGGPEEEPRTAAAPESCTVLMRNLEPGTTARDILFEVFADDDVPAVVLLPAGKGGQLGAELRFGNAADAAAAVERHRGGTFRGRPLRLSLVVDRTRRPAGRAEEKAPPKPASPPAKRARAEEEAAAPKRSQEKEKEPTFSVLVKSKKKAKSAGASVEDLLGLGDAGGSRKRKVTKAPPPRKAERHVRKRTQ